MASSGLTTNSQTPIGCFFEVDHHDVSALGVLASDLIHKRLRQILIE